MEERRGGSGFTFPDDLHNESTVGSEDDVYVGGINLKVVSSKKSSVSMRYSRSSGFRSHTFWIHVFE